MFYRTSFVNIVLNTQYNNDCASTIVSLQASSLLHNTSALQWCRSIESRRYKRQRERDIQRERERESTTLNIELASESFNLGFVNSSA